MSGLTVKLQKQPRNASLGMDIWHSKDRRAPQAGRKDRDGEGMSVSRICSDGRGEGKKDVSVPMQAVPETKVVDG